jgi:hypothetical protein
MAHLKQHDVNGDGCLALRELAIALRAVDATVTTR